MFLFGSSSDKEQKIVKQGRAKRTSFGVIMTRLLVSVLLGVFVVFAAGCSSKEGTAAGGGTQAQLVSPMYFEFRQNAFECGTENGTTQIVAQFSEDYDTSKFDLYAECTETGEKITMTDDGDGADTVANDNCFYGFASFSVDEPGTLTYVLKIKNKEYSIQNCATEVIFYTEAQIRQEFETQREIKSELQDLSSSYVAEDEPENPTELANEYQDAVEDMKAYLDELVANGDIVSYKFSAPNFIIELPIGSCVYTFSPGDDDTLAGSGSATFHGGYTESFLADEDLASLLLLPLDHELPYQAFENALVSVGEADLGYKETNVARGTAVNGDLMKALHSYRVIAITSHGCSFDNELGAGFLISAPYENISYEDYSNNRLIPDIGTDTAVLTSAFFEYYYEDNSLNDCLFYIGCCQCADNPVLAKTLLRKGAEAVIGYQNSVYASYDDNMVTTIFDVLTEKNANGDVPTITEAVGKAKDQHGHKDPTNTQWFYFWSAVGEDERAQMKLFNKNARDPFKLVSDTNTGTITGRVFTADGGRAIPNARVLVTPVNANGSVASRPIAAFYTGGNGEFSYNMPIGQYQIYVAANGYVSLTFYTTVRENYTTHLETFLLVEGTEGENGVASGIVSSAMTGEGLDGVELTIRSGWNNSSAGSVVESLTTDEDGRYSVSLPIGNYTVNCEREDYVSSYFNIVVQSGSAENQNGSMSLDVEGDYFRIVLTWNEHPRDVDLHIEGPRENGGTFHTYFSSMEYSEGDMVVCMLDVDDTTSYGPETITLLATNHDEPYYCYLHRYAGNGTLASSGATLNIYCGAQHVATLAVPTNEGTQDIWNAFAIVDGTIKLQNTITSTPDLAYAG